MAPRPPITPGDWITIGETYCVVAAVRPEGDAMGDCEVVYNPVKPANEDAKWTGEKWSFVHQGQVAGYAANYPRLAEFVGILKARGRR